MKKLILFISVLIILLSSPAYALIHTYKGLTGGANANLDGIPVANISDGEIATGADSSNVWRWYRYDASNNNSTNPESSVNVIVPDDNGTGTGAWLIISSIGVPSIELSDIQDNTLTGAAGVLSIEGNELAFAAESQTLTNKTIDGDDNTLQDIAYSSIKSTSRSGSDTTLITGTEGTSGNCAEWDANGDLVDSGSACGGSGTPTDITVADESSDTTSFPAFFTAATGDLGPKTDASNLTYNASTGEFAAASLSTTQTGSPILLLDDTVGDDFSIDASASGEASFKIGSDEIFNLDANGMTTALPVIHDYGAPPLYISMDGGTGDISLQATYPNLCEVYVSCSSGAGDLTLTLWTEPECNGITDRPRIVHFQHRSTDGTYECRIDPYDANEDMVMGGQNPYTDGYYATSTVKGAWVELVGTPGHWRGFKLSDETDWSSQ